jgi:hypothetical protein
VLPYRFARPSFENAYALLSPSQRRLVQDIIADVRRNPDPDDIRKISIPYVGSMYVRAFGEEGCWLFYYVQDGIVWCVSCGQGSEYIDVLVDVELG